MVDRVRVNAHAKANLVLHVLNREASGFHNIETIFALLDLHDVVTVEKRDGGISVDVEGEDTGPERQNLAYRAAQLACERSGQSFGVHIHIQKSIPVQAGLGGGSSDGAAALHAVNFLAGDVFSIGQIREFAAEFGCDIPFFVSRSAFAIGRGRGEELVEVPGPTRAHALIVQPAFGVSTRDAYESLAESRRGDGGSHNRKLSDKGFLEWPDIVEVSANDFEEVLYAKSAQLRELHTGLQSTGAFLTRLCGSGSAILGVFPTRSERDSAVTAFPDASHVLPTTVLAAPAPEPQPY